MRSLLVLALIGAVACASTDIPRGQATFTGPGTEPAPASTPARTTEPAEPTPTSTPARTTEPPAPTPTSAEDRGPVDIEVTDVATGLEVPWALAFAPDGTAYGTERPTGVVYELGPDGEVRTVAEFDVDATGEGGLLGLALSPDFEQDGYLYVYYSTASVNRIVRFREGEQPEVVLDGIPKSPIHDGGRLAFGPDGMLYATTGDASQPELAQDGESLAGKILRLTPDGGIPADNPFPGSPVWTLGHRNVQGLAWDGRDRLYATELGPDRDDEINRIEPGNNYGWPEVTGRADVEGFTDPIVVKQPAEASWSGATVLVDGAIPQWEGDLFAAALRGERLWRVDLAADGTVRGTSDLYTGEFGRLRFAVQAPDGSLWVGTSNLDGRGSPRHGDDRILRIGPARG